LEAAAGSNQSATVGKPVPVQPAVRVLNGKGKPLRGQEVVFSVAAGGGLVSGGQTTTDDQGVARVGAWILGPKAGEQILQALVGGLAPFYFRVLSVADDPASVVIKAGDGQTGVVGSALEIIPSVLVRDAYGNLVEGAPVQFLVTAGEGFLSLSSWETDASGVAQAGAWTLGTVPGTNTLLASVQGLTPLTFSATGLPDAPHEATVLLGDGQTGEVGTALPQRPTLVVADRYGNLLEGVLVTFEVTQGGGSVDGPNQLTGPSGVAISGPWTLGPVAGLQSLQAVVPGLDPLILTAVAQPGPPASLIPLVEGVQKALVGSDVPEPPRVRVEDRFGNPIEGVVVRFGSSGSPDPEDSPGSLTPAESVTDATGEAKAQQWTLGTAAGTYSALAEVDGLSQSAEFFAEAVPDTPARLVIQAGDNQTADLGTAVAVPPSVRVEDQHGNGVEAVTVGFAVEEGGGAVQGGEALTDNLGVATVGGWVLGPNPGTNLLSASAAGLDPVVFRATALSAEPVTLAKVSGDNQVAEVGSGVATAPKVRVTDAQGAPVALVPVVFSVLAGGGSVSEAETATDGNGFASAGAWVLGTSAGPNSLQASVAGLSPVVFSATGTAGPPASMELSQGGTQTVLAGTMVPVPPSVRLQDEYGNPTHNVPVEFVVTAGGGSVTGGVAVTDGQGVAEALSWAVGPAPGPNQLTARSSGLPDVLFHAEGIPAGGFQLELDFRTALDPVTEAVFLDAATRWEEIIPGDIPDFGVTLPAGGCQPVTEAGGIDDLKVYITVLPIDGSGGILGQAGPCYYRTAGSPFPITGVMQLDEADVADLLAAGLLEDVVVHEMAHILGFGTLWNVSSNDLLVGAGTDEPYFTGAAAVSAFDAAGGEFRVRPKVPVENTGGPGTRDGHWRESVHNSELMTGWIEGGGVPNPLSAITIGSLADMGYAVNMSAADPYVLFDPQGAPGREATGIRIRIQELPPPTPIPAGAGGRRP
jgi:adhesin/invasin